MKALFVAILEDNEIFTGGSYEKTRWLELPKDKKIKRLFYTLPDGNHLCLDLYDRYFLMIEATADINGDNAGKVVIEYSYIMGEKDNKVICYKINLRTDIGNIQRQEFAKDSEFVLGLSKDGWR